MLSDVDLSLPHIIKLLILGFAMPDQSKSYTNSTDHNYPDDTATTDRVKACLAALGSSNFTGVKGGKVGNDYTKVQETINALITCIKI